VIRALSAIIRSRAIGCSFIEIQMRRDIRFHVSVRIASSRAAALAKTAARYSSVANIGRYRLGSGPAERTSETILTIAAKVVRFEDLGRHLSSTLAHAMPRSR
jgi:hypothetical protein